MKTEDTAVKTEDSSVDDVDVDDTAAATASAYLQIKAHTASVFSMNHP